MKAFIGLLILSVLPGLVEAKAGGEDEGGRENEGGNGGCVRRMKGFCV